jgi:DNA-binding HxlR family transcriptional regulator
MLVEALLAGPRRFTDLQHAVEGIAPNILARRLEHLEREGVLVAVPYQERPTRHAYELTAPGRELAGALRLLAHWAAADSASTAPVRHAACGTPVEARWFCPTCARIVDDEEAMDLRWV